MIDFLYFFTFSLVFCGLMFIILALFKDSLEETIGISVTTFILLIVSYLIGWI